MLTDQLGNSSSSFSQYKDRVASLSNEFEIGLFFFLIKKSIRWIFLFFLFSFTFAYLFLRYTPEVFESKTIIQINNDDQASRILNVQNINEVQDDIAKSIELLRAKVFFMRVLSTLPLKVTYFSEGTFRENEQYKKNIFSADVNVKSESIFGIRFYVYFENENNGIVTYVLGGKKKECKFISGEWVKTNEIDFKIAPVNIREIRNQQNAVKVNSLYFIANKIEALANQYYSHLNVRLLSDAAKTIEISYQDINAGKTMDIVTSMANQFIDYDIEKKGESSQKVLTFLDDQLAVVYDRLRNSETSIYEYKKDNKVSDSGSKNFTDAASARLNSLEEESISLELRENVLVELENSIDAKKDMDSYHLVSLLTGIEFENSLNGQITSLEMLLKNKEELLYQVTPASEKIKSIEFQIEVQKKLLLESVRSIKDKLQIRIKSLNQKITELEKQHYSVPSEEVEYARLQRLFAINEKFYNLLLEKKAEYQISQAGNISRHVVLDYASLPVFPVSPKKPIVFTVAFICALLFSLFLVFSKYIIHDQLNSITEINKIIHGNIPALGIVPKYKKDIPVSQLLVDKNPKSLIAESFRSIRTNLQFICNEPGAKTAAVTSTISGEGKTFVAINLAGIIAYAGRKVIVIDLDMRKPKIHMGFGAQNIKGMSTVLIGKDSLEECIQHSSFENLDFITAGPIPPNPSELIITQKMTQLIDFLKTKYDFIVFDTPPVGLVTDGISIIQKVDYPVYIFRAEYSKRHFVQNLDRLHNENNMKNLSYVLNGVDVDAKSYGYNYGYGYGYGYGRNYGYYDDKVSMPKSKNIFKRFFS
jgi:tyrosine-protein kinase Etk/Wzc